jgi:MFS family permease
MQITGLGALVVTPIVGNLSDKYGRKALMTLPVTVAILPLGMRSLVRLLQLYLVGFSIYSFRFVSGSYLGVQPLGGVLLRVLRR